MSEFLKKNRYFIFCITIFLFFAAISYRDFLVTLKLMLFSSYNFSMLPFDEYYKFNLYFDGKISESPGYPWVSRYLANFVNYFFYKVFPCLTVSKIPIEISKNVYCSFWSIALANYTFTILFQVSSFFYAFKILKRPFNESILVGLISFFIISLSDRYGVDRFSIFYISLFLIFSQKIYFKYLLILLSIFINEKITIFIASFYFCECYLNFHNRKNIQIFNFILPTILFGLYLFYFVLFDASDNVFKIQNHLDGSIVDRSFISFHGLANSFIPVFLVIFPYIYFYNKPNILKKFRLNKISVIILLTFILLGFIGGGSGNTGRLVVYSSPIFISTYGYFLFYLLKKFKL